MVGKKSKRRNFETNLDDDVSSLNKVQKINEDSQDFHKIENVQEEEKFELKPDEPKHSKTITKKIDDSQGLISQIRSKNLTGIKKVKHKVKEASKSTFKNKSKEEKLKLLEKLHPF